MNTGKLLAGLRICLGLIYLWAFIDKLFGLGLSTPRENAWISGVSPTHGFLYFASRGPFASICKTIAGNGFVDWMFMLGLLLIGIALIFGIARRVAGFSGAVMMAGMWLAVLPPKNHPFLCEQFVYMIIFLILAGTAPVFSLSQKWSETWLVKKFPILE